MTSEAFEVSLYTPKQHVFTKSVYMVVVPGEDGCFGVLNLHAPLVALLKPGLLEVHVDEVTVLKYVVSYGVARVNDGKLDLVVEDEMLLDNVNTVLFNNDISAYQQALALSHSVTQKKNLGKKIDFLTACVELKK